MSESRPGRVLHRLLLVPACLVLLWVSSLFFSVTRFGDAVTVTLQDGFVGVYWGGDAHHRNAFVYNHFSAPWSPGSGAGRHFPNGMTWDVYCTGGIVRASEWSRAIQYGGFIKRILGFWALDASLRGREHYVVLPIWIGVVAAVAGTAYASWRNRRLRVIGACHHCGYSLIGNTSGVCPECGQPT